MTDREVANRVSVSVPTAQAGPDAEALSAELASEFRSLGHRVVDWLADYLEGIEDERISPSPSPASIAKRFEGGMPEGETPAGSVFDRLIEDFAPHTTHTGHPGYMGLITPSALPIGAIGDLIASVLNQNIGAYTIGPGGVFMERQVVRWLCDRIGYGPAAGGNLTSGGMMANFIALKLARDFASGDHAQETGVQGAWTAYVSEERHVSLDKAGDAVGIGRDGVRIVPADESYRIRIPALEEMIAHDRARGVRPMCILGMGGTTNIGAVDDLTSLRRIADRERAWFHVDAAYGGGMLLSQENPGLLAAIETADSVAIDPHKWFFAPLDAGAILVKDERRLTRSFGLAPSYLTDPLDPEGARYQYYVHGFEQSRRLRALKVWMILQRYGADRIGEWVDANVAHARRLWALCEESDDFEAAAEPRMSAICIRYVAGPLDDERRTRLHHVVARRIEEDGQFWISTAVLKGRTWFRICPVNVRTRLEHMDALMDSLRALCREQARE
ncbi:MAG: pyridoxal phosphate-dependent decarboxylase family protein [Longimicrobiales bacterium]